MPAQHSRTRRGRVNSPAVATPRAQRGGRRGEPTPPPSPSPPRQEASSRHDPAVAASVHAPEVQGATPVPASVPTPEALEAFRSHWATKGRQPTYQEYQDFLDYWRIFGRQAQTTPVTTPAPEPAPPRAPVVHSTPGEASGPSQALALSKLLKEARQLGCGSFDGTSDAMIAKEWVKRVIATFDDMSLGGETRLRVATRLLEGRARIWWESLKSRSFGQVTWSDFLREFDEEYYTRFHRDQKRHEFMRLVQGNKTVTEYETELKDLANFVPELAPTEEVLCSKFEVGLNLGIRERMTVTSKQSFKEMVQSALRAEQLVREGKRVRENIAKRRSLEAGQPSKKSRSEGSSKGNSTPGPTRPPLSQSGDQQRLTRSDSAPSVRGPEASNRCKNCGKPHKGQCQTPRKCFHCGQTGHLRSACPELGRGGSTPASQDRPLAASRGSRPRASSRATTKSGAR
ncbi:uncharacterized protein LOC120250538 [Dioscorea cayenensis subsp. rotundata]|uniref:Uncharacterized protein LOC120250538 n=1 Tax=Dioscorea cayennensis subsp. rotundata TaxID=55577 RepID=A0AB40AK34_DIOCR|nr:uncharacterized protein LOC120250538 [Dioscorea cayenensis subsp. rotundata]